MNILGYVIDEDSFRPNDELVTGIVEAAVPENKQQLRSFLGLAGFYAKFVANFSTKVSTMREVQNTEPFYWTGDADRAFRNIKSNIVNSPGLELFDPMNDVIVTTDASGYGLGAVVTQIQNDGSEVMVACASSTLTAPERNYPVGEREALACVWAVERYHTYLWGETFHSSHRSPSFGNLTLLEGYWSQTHENSEMECSVITLSLHN